MKSQVTQQQKHIIKEEQLQSRINDHIPTRQDILAVYESKRQNEKYEPSIQKFVELLGGIDLVMQVMLTSADHNMSANNCVEMYRYLNDTTTISSSYDHIEEVGTPGVTTKKFQWTLHIKDNGLHSLSPSAHRHFSKYIFSNWSMGIMMVMLTVAFVSTVMPRQDVLSYSWLYMFTNFILWLCPIPWFVVALLLINKRLIFRIAVHPDTWIMSGTGCAAFVYYLILLRMHDYGVSLTVFILFALSWTVLSVLGWVFICSLDALYGWRQKSKIFVTTSSAFTLAVFSFIYGFLINDVIVDIPMLGEYGSFSITGKISNCFYILSLFLGKMAFNAWVKGDERCIALRYSPYIEWKDSLSVRG